jgi:glycosyltransferase involved in cell wall biosynthesis
MHSFHLVMSTVGRPVELARFLDRLQRGGEDVFVTLVEQNEQPTCAAVLAPWVARGAAEYLHEPYVRGLSRGRNRGLEHLRGRVVAFPDDDCWYEDGLLEAVRVRLAGTGADGYSVLQSTPDGAGSMLRWSSVPGRIRRSTVFRTTTSASLFFTRELVERVGAFDPTLGTGSGTAFGAGEESDFVLRALALGADLRYDPMLRVIQPDWRDTTPPLERAAKVRRYNRGFGRVLRKHRMYGAFAYWAARSVAGTVVHTVRGDRAGARHQRDQLLARVHGFVAGTNQLQAGTR